MQSRKSQQGKTSKSAKGILSISFCIVLATVLAWTGILVYYIRYRQQHEPVVSEDKLKNEADTFVRPLGIREAPKIIENREELGAQPIKSQHQAQQQQKEEANAKSLPVSPPTDNDSDIHVVFSTDCTPFQDWQVICEHKPSYTSLYCYVTRAKLLSLLLFTLHFRLSYCFTPPQWSARKDPSLASPLAVTMQRRRS